MTLQLGCARFPLFGLVPNGPFSVFFPQIWHQKAPPHHHHHISHNHLHHRQSRLGRKFHQSPSQVGPEKSCKSLFDNLSHHRQSLYQDDGKIGFTG